MIIASVIITIAAFIATLIIIRMWLNRLEQKSQKSDELVEWIKDLGRRVENSNANVDHKLSQNMTMFNNRLDQASLIMGQVHKSIGEFTEIGRSMQEIQQFLQSPKLRGNIGEQVLKELLSQYFPPDSYVLQHSFKNGERVDAIIKTSQGIIPIDSKFPLDNFRKLMQSTNTIERDRHRREFVNDVKRHIHDIARKYIQVGDGTVDYALIYIPSESIYYEILTSAELCDYANSKRILPVSPMSFYAYMKAILMSFEGQRIESQAKEILALLQAIKKDYEKTDEAISVLTKHVTNAYNQSNQVSKVFLSLGQKLNSTHLIPPSQAEEKLFD